MSELSYLSATALNQWLMDNERTPPVVLDVREPDEIATASMPKQQCIAIPMGKIAECAASLLPTDKTIVTVCHHGKRAEHIAQWLLANGFSQVAVLQGGIHAWSEQVDSTVPQY